MIEDNTATGEGNSGVGSMFITVDDSGKLLPMGADGTTFTDLSTYCSATSTNAQNGIACTYKALTDKDYFNSLP